MSIFRCYFTSLARWTLDWKFSNCGFVNEGLLRAMITFQSTLSNDFESSEKRIFLPKSFLHDYNFFELKFMVPVTWEFLVLPTKSRVACLEIWIFWAACLPPVSPVPLLTAYCLILQTTHKTKKMTKKPPNSANPESFIIELMRI